MLYKNIENNTFNYLHSFLSRDDFTFSYIIYSRVYTTIYVDKPTNFKDNLRTNEAGFGKKLRTTEARFDFTGPYKTN